MAAPALSQPWRPGRGAVAGLTTWGWPVSLPSTKTQAWAACPGSSWECGAGWAALRPAVFSPASLCLPSSSPAPQARSHHGAHPALQVHDLRAGGAR